LAFHRVTQKLASEARRDRHAPDNRAAMFLPNKSDGLVIFSPSNIDLPPIDGERTVLQCIRCQFMEYQRNPVERMLAARQRSASDGKSWPSISRFTLVRPEYGAQQLDEIGHLRGRAFALKLRRISPCALAKAWNRPIRICAISSFEAEDLSAIRTMASDTANRFLTR